MKQGVDKLKQWQAVTGNALILASGLGLLSAWLVILQAWMLAVVVSAVIIEQRGLSDLMPWLWSMLGVFAARAGLIWAAEQSAFQAASRVKLKLRSSLLKKIRDLGPAFLANQRSGELTNTLTDGIEAMEAYYAKYIPAISLMALTPLSILVFIFPIDWISALVMLFTAPLIPLFMILIGRGAEHKNQQQWQKLARMSSHFLDTIQGLTSLKLFNASRREAAVIAKISDQYRHATLSVLRIAFLSSFALEFFSTISIAIVAVLVGFRLYWGELDFLYGFFVLLLAPEFYLPLRNMGQHYHARMDAIGAVEGMLEILNTELPTEKQKGDRNAIREPQKLTFEAVGFSYPDGRQALHEIDFSIQRGEQLALVGPSGAGKSTLINLLLGFNQPSRGQILIDHQPLSEIDLASWRSQIIWLPQRPKLFHASVADNIRLAAPDATVSQVELAASMARADQFIERLPQGYETLIGEAGHGLSGGEIQRIALARAFLKDAPLVILDEATASLDLQSESQIQEAITLLSEGRTLLMVAHRLKTVERMPRILVLDQGRLVESGDHQSLLRQQGIYHGLVSAYSGNSA